MGRLKAKSDVPKKNQELNKEKKEKKGKYKRNYQNKFRVGNASQGHGFAIVKKKQFLSKFRRKQNKKQKDNENEDFIHIKPLAEDSTRDSSAKFGETSANKTNNPSTLTRKNKNRRSVNIQKLEIDYEAIKKEREAKAEELKAERAENEKKLRKNLEKRRKITKKLSKKTKRGQPVMANRLELILSKLKNS